MNIINNNNNNMQGDSLEKMKYGNPGRNLLVTVGVIIFIAVAVTFAFMSRKVEITGITPQYAVYYPASTTLYVDARLDTNNISEINKLTNLNSKNLPDLLSRSFFDNYSYRKRNKINKLMSKSFGNEFAFGLWNDSGNKVVQKSLVIMPLEREIYVRSLFKLLVKKRSRLVDINFKGYKITTTAGKKISFAIVRNKIFVADSYETLTFVIKSYLLGESESLYDRENVKKALKMLNKERLGTVILANSGSVVSKINEMTGGNLQTDNIKSFMNSMDVTAASVLLGKGNVYINSYTPYDLSRIENRSLKHAFKVMFASRGNNFTTDFLPENTVAFVAIKELSDFANFSLELSGLRHGQEYVQFKQFVTMLTSLDLDKDIISSLKGNTLLGVIDTGNKQDGYILTLSNKQDTDYVVSKLSKLIPMQIPSMVTSGTAYRKLNLNIMSSPKYPQKIIFGRLRPDLYTLGEKRAVETVIDTVTGNRQMWKDNNTEEVPDLFYDSRIMAYINLEKISKTQLNNKVKDNVLFNKVRAYAESILFSVKGGRNVICGSVKLKLK